MQVVDSGCRWWGCTTCWGRGGSASKGRLKKRRVLFVIGGSFGFFRPIQTGVPYFGNAQERKATKRQGLFWHIYRASEAQSPSIPKFEGFSKVSETSTTCLLCLGSGNQPLLKHAQICCKPPSLCDSMSLSHANSWAHAPYPLTAAMLQVETWRFPAIPLGFLGLAEAGFGH